MEWIIPGLKGFQKSDLGMEEPILEFAQKIELKDLSGILIPGLGFDRQGQRLGRGQGYFDKTLSSSSQSLKKVGVCFQIQLIPELPSEEHDIKMNFLFTEEETLTF